MQQQIDGYLLKQDREPLTAAEEEALERLTDEIVTLEEDLPGVPDIWGGDLVRVLVQETGIRRHVVETALECSLESLKELSEAQRNRAATLFGVRPEAFLPV